MGQKAMGETMKSVRRHAAPRSGFEWIGGLRSTGRKHPRHIAVVAYLALFLALSGSSYAATSVGGSTHGHAKASSGPRGPRGPRGRRGPRGLKGDKGDKGDPGAAGP